jgi:hypothetical protein
VTDSWQTPQLREALARLEYAEVGLDRAIVSAKQVSRQVPSSRLSEEDVRQIEEFARGGNAPKGLRELQRRIDDGELSWQDIADGRHLDDPEVRAALATGVGGMQRAYAAIQEGHDLDDIIEGGDTAPSVPAASDDDDDEYGYEFLRDQEE